jgi:hypothetical protein
MGQITKMNTLSLEKAKNYEDAKLEGLFDDKEFSIELSNLIDKKGLKTKDIVDFSNISKSYLNDLKDCHKNILPKRSKLLDLCLAMHTTIDETDYLLRLAQYKPLDPRGDTVDQIFIWGLSHDKTNMEIREVLYNNNHPEFMLEKGSEDE